MGEEKLNASGFEFYEGIRIAVPGGIILALYVAVNATFHLEAPEPNALLGLVMAIGAGLVLYYADVSGRAQVYLAAQPHRIFDDWGLVPNGMSAMNVYFVVLDAVMPGGIRNRALYFGSIFRIGFEAVYLAALSSIGVLTAAMTTTTPSASRVTDTTVLWLAVPLHVLAGAAGVWEGYGIARRRAETPRGALREVGRRVTQQIGGSGAAALVAAALAVAAYFTVLDWSGLLIAAVALTTALWALRYLHGYRRDDHRRNIDPATATTLLTTPTVLVTVLAAIELPGRSVLGVGAALGWPAVALIAVLLLARRGHEKRLWAAYHTQRAWLELRRTEMTQLITGQASPGAPGEGPDA